MPWWVSLGFFGLAVMLWLSGRRNPDEVIGLLEKLLAALLVVVVLLESRNMLLSILSSLLAVLQLPATLRELAHCLAWGFTSRMEILQELGNRAWAASTAWPRSTDCSISSPHFSPQW